MKGPLDPLDKIRSHEPATERRGRPVGRIEGAYDRDHWGRRKAQLIDRLSLVEAIGRVVKLQKAGTPNEHKGLCPFHTEKTPSFTVNTKKGLFHCFGCGANGRNVIDFAMQVQGLDFKQAIESLESANGLRYLETARPVPKPAVPQVEEVKRDQGIQRIWGQAVHDPAVDHYLRGRALVPCAEYGFGDPAVNGGWPADLRFHPRLWHGIERRELPAMVAPFRKGGEIVALHRTYLKRVTGGWVKAGTKSDKMHLGPRAGALILLCEPVEVMTAGEGIETSLSTMQLWRRAGFAYGSADAMAAVEPPFLCTDLLIGADWNAKNRTGEIAAWKAKKAFERGSRRIVVKVPNLRDRDKADFNDVLQQRAAERRSEGSP